MQDHDGLPGDGTMCEDETATIGTHTMLEVLPVAQGMDCLILTDLEGWQKLALLTSSLLPSYASPPLLSLPSLSLSLPSFPLFLSPSLHPSLLHSWDVIISHKL